MENFETYLDDFLYNLKCSTLNNLLIDNADYIKLNDDIDKLTHSITSESPEISNKLDTLINKITELENFENEFLYKQGYKDCFKLLKLLDT
ncbi:MAG: hypothetical protein J5507_03320 [Clostridia bacterium]|nr:hypothetical protein [Clostridia bacterium]